MAKFSIRQLLALTALCAVWFATFNPGQLGVFVHIALGYLFVVVFLAANGYGLRFLAPASCFVSRSLTTLCSLFWLFMIPIIFQADTSRAEHWEMFFECVGYLTILVSTLAAAEWIRSQTRTIDSPNRQWLVYVAISSLLFGIAIMLLAFAEYPGQQPEDNLTLGIVLFNAAYLVAYAAPASWGARKPQSSS
jgi:hypothetical protein